MGICYNRRLNLVQIHRGIRLSPVGGKCFGVADAIEPNRGQAPELESLRHISWQNLYKTVQQICDYSLQYLLSHHRTIHPRMILTRNWALHTARQATKEKLNAPSHNDS